MIKRCLLLLFLLALGASPILAQDSLTQTGQITDDGLTLTIAYPASWVEKVDGNRLLLATSQDALDALNTSGIVSTPGDVGIVLYMPSALSSLNLDATGAPDKIVAAYLQMGKVEGEVESSTDFAVPAATALIDVPNQPGLKGLIGALGFPEGTIIFGAIPGDKLDDIVLAIVKSITLTSESDAQPETSVELTLSDAAIFFDVPQRGGSPLQLALNLPDDWDYRYAEQDGLLYLGSSQAVVEKISSSSPGLKAGEIGVTVVMPDALTKVGITRTDTPEDTITSFETAFKATGAVHSDDSFDVPAAYARVSGDNLPEGGGLAFALAFDAGTILIVVQPGSIAPESVVGFLQSIRLGEPEAATSAPQAEELRQWAVFAEGTSQYGEERWSFQQATGEPNTPTCGDYDTAWASAQSTGRAILRVVFEQPVIPTQINIYQSYNPGAIVEVNIGSAENPDQVLPLPNSADPPGNTDCPGVFTLDISGATAPVNSVVIYIDQDITLNWNEIDAVELVGTPVE